MLMMMMILMLYKMKKSVRVASVRVEENLNVS